MRCRFAVGMDYENSKGNNNISTVGIMIGQAMPGTLMIEPFHAGYMPYTTVWALVSVFIFWPATALAVFVLRQPPHGVVHWLVNVAYAAVLTWLTWKARLHRNRGDWREKSASQISGP